MNPTSSELRDDGGPVYPVPHVNPELASTGVTLREWFASTAPEPPPWWETPHLDPASLPEWPTTDIAELEKSDQPIVGMWLTNPGADALPERLTHIEKKLRHYRDTHKAASNAVCRDTWFAWRWYYADQMLQLRLAPPPLFPVVPWRPPAKGLS